MRAFEILTLAKKHELKDENGKGVGNGSFPHVGGDRSVSDVRGAEAPMRSETT